jgi:hypothetical protein
MKNPEQIYGNIESRINNRRKYGRKLRKLVRKMIVATRI